MWILSHSAPRRTQRIWRKAWWALHYGGRGGPTVLAISAFDMALWDLKAKRARLPLWNLLGGFDARVPCYAGGIDLDLALDKLLRQTEDNLAKGFRAIKMKVGRKRLAEDVERVKAMRAHLGEGFPLMVDANMTWSVDEAIRAARAFQPFDLTWLEEPTVPEDPEGHARIVREGGLPTISLRCSRTSGLLQMEPVAQARRRHMTFLHQVFLEHPSSECCRYAARSLNAASRKRSRLRSPDPPASGHQWPLHPSERPRATELATPPR
jgi:hypothetical protein